MSLESEFVLCLKQESHLLLEVAYFVWKRQKLLEIWKWHPSCVRDLTLFNMSFIQFGVRTTENGSKVSVLVTSGPINRVQM
jgi:hypothetical protein